MTRIIFQNPDGHPLGGATVAVTAAPGEMTDIGYVTDDAGSISLPVATPGNYQFTLGSADGGRLVASALIGVDDDATVTTRTAG